MESEITNSAEVLNNDFLESVNVFKEEGFTISISKDHLSVSLDLFKPKNETGLITCVKIKTELENLNIKSPLHEDKIKSAVTKFNNDNNSVEGIVISSGNDCQIGKDGWFELLCGENLNQESKLKFDGKLDHIISVKQDELIGVLHLPQNGKDGFDVFGKIIPAINGKKADIGFGENIYTIEKIVSNVHSSIDGFLNIKNNTISVSESFTVYEDLNYQIGNIKGFGSLKVLGNVLNGIYLNLKNNIDVGGYVGDVELIAGGNVKILGGFMGAGGGKIKAGGNVDVKFVQDQQIFSRGSLNFIREIVHSKIYVKDNVIGKGNHASIIGGYTVAGKNVEVYSAGNEYGLNTVIEVGYDYELKDVLVKNRTKINDLRKEVKKIDKEIFGYSEMKRLNELMYNKLKLLADKHKTLIEEIRKLHEENNELIKTVRRPSDSYVKILNTIYPGTKIIINRKNYIIKEKMFSKTFKLSEDKQIIII